MWGGEGGGGVSDFFDKLAKDPNPTKTNKRKCYFGGRGELGLGEAK